MSIYKKDWVAILEVTQNANPFLEYEFVYNLWEVLGLGNGIEIYAVKEYNRIIAFFPFQLKQTWFGSMLHFIAQDEVNMMDIIAKDMDKERVIMFVFDALIRRKKSIVFFLDGFLGSGNTSRKLSKYLQARSMKEYSRVGIVQLNSDHKNISKDFSDESTTKTIFSTNTIRAKTYRNFLWTKEMITSKVIKN